MVTDDIIENIVGNGKVVLLAGGGKVFTDVAARFCKSEKSLESIVSSDYNAELVKRIISSGHMAATEFDYYVFGVEGYSRVTETQLVRKRLASYLIKSGRATTKSGQRKYEIVLPQSIKDHYGILAETWSGSSISLNEWLYLGKVFYERLKDSGVKEEEARYIKPQATEFKAIIGMNAHALIDWFKIRCCRNAQTEIRDLANKMLKLCKEASPDVFYTAGASCKVLGYCPENSLQNEVCKNSSRYITHDEVKNAIKEYRENHLEFSTSRKILR